MVLCREMVVKWQKKEFLPFLWQEKEAQLIFLRVFYTSIWRKKDNGGFKWQTSDMLNRTPNTMFHYSPFALILRVNRPHLNGQHVTAVVKARASLFTHHPSLHYSSHNHCATRCTWYQSDLLQLFPFNLWRSFENGQDTLRQGLLCPSKYSTRQRYPQWELAHGGWKSSGKSDYNHSHIHL